MLVDRIVPFIIIGLGFLICQKIFQAHPLSISFLKQQPQPAKVLAIWSVALAIIFVQLNYLWKIFARLAEVEVLAMPIYILLFLFIFFYFWSFYYRR